MHEQLDSSPELSALRSFIRRVCEEVLAERNARTLATVESAQNGGPQYLTYKEAAERYNVKVGTLYAWVHENAGIPFIRIRRRFVRFPRQAFDEWFASKLASPAATARRRVRS